MIFVLALAFMYGCNKNCFSWESQLFVCGISIAIPEPIAEFNHQVLAVSFDYVVSNSCRQIYCQISLESTIFMISKLMIDLDKISAFLSSIIRSEIQLVWSPLRRRTG